MWTKELLGRFPAFSDEAAVEKILEWNGWGKGRRWDDINPNKGTRFYKKSDPNLVAQGEPPSAGAEEGKKRWSEPLLLPPNRRPKEPVWFPASEGAQVLRSLFSVGTQGGILHFASPSGLAIVRNIPEEWEFRIEKEGIVSRPSVLEHFNYRAPDEGQSIYLFRPDGSVELYEFNPGRKHTGESLLEKVKKVYRQGVPADFTPAAGVEDVLEELSYRYKVQPMEGQDQEGHLLTVNGTPGYFVPEDTSRFASTVHERFGTQGYDFELITDVDLDAVVKALRSFAAERDAPSSEIRVAVQYSKDAVFVKIDKEWLYRINRANATDIEQLKTGSGATSKIPPFMLASAPLIFDARLRRAVSSSDIEARFALLPSELRNAAGAEEKVLKGHSLFVRAVAFSPDGKYLVSGEENRNLILWDVLSGKELWRFSTSQEGPANQKGFSGVAFSPDGKKIAATLFDGTLLLINATPQAPKEQDIERRTFEHKTWEKSWAVAFSPSGNEVVTAGGAGLQFWSAQPGQADPSKTVPGEFFSVAFNPEGSRLVTGGAGEIRLWDAASQQSVAIFPEGRSEVAAVAFSSDGTKIASGNSQGAVRIRDLESQGMLLNYTRDPDGVRSVAFSPNGTQLASAHLSGKIRLWNVESGTLSGEQTGHQGIVHAVAFSPDGKWLASGSADKTIRLRPAPPAAGAEEGWEVYKTSPAGKFLMLGAPPALPREISAVDGDLGVIQTEDNLLYLVRIEHAGVSVLPQTEHLFHVFGSEEDMKIKQNFTVTLPDSRKWISAALRGKGEATDLPGEGIRLTRTARGLRLDWSTPQRQSYYFIRLIPVEPLPAGAEENAHVQAYRAAVGRIEATLKDLGIQTPLTPGEIWTLSHLAGSNGSVVIIPRDQRIEAAIPAQEVGSDPDRARDRYRVVTTVPLLRAARQKDQPVTLLVNASLLNSALFTSLRAGKTKPTLSTMGMTAEDALLFRDVAVLAQGEDPGNPRWKPAQSREKISPWAALQKGAVGYKAGVLLGAKLPGRSYHARWDRLAEQNLEWVKEQARLIRKETGGAGLGLLAAALIYAAPPSDYFPDPSDVKREEWDRFVDALTQGGHSPDGLREELRKAEPANWAVEAQMKMWLKSNKKWEAESTREFAQAHEQMTHRMAESWGNAPGITLIMASGPVFAESSEQWDNRREWAAQSIAELSQVPGIRGRMILPSRNKYPSVYKAEMGVMQSSGLLAGIAPGRTLTQAVVQREVLGGGDEFYATKHPRFLKALQASARNMNQVLNRFSEPASIWSAYGITPEQAARLVAAARNSTERVRAEFGKIKVSATNVIGVGPLEADRYADALRVIGQLLEEPVRRQLFVVTRTANQGLYLKSLGLAASDQPIGVINQLKERFGDAVLRADYHADEAEAAVFKDAAALMGARIEIIPRATQAELRNFLQELLATLAGIPSQSVPDQFNLDQLTADIDLLIKA